MIELAVNERIAQITLAHAPVNALSPELLAGFHTALDSLQARDDWQLLVVASGLRVFSAGGELDSMLARIEGPDAAASLGSYVTEVQKLNARIESLPQVTLARCDGSALGGGLELALACDLRVASAKARFGLPEVGLGLLPGAGGTQRLTRLCGKPAAARLILGAEVVDAAEALQLGIVQWVLEPPAMEAFCQALSRRLAGLPPRAQQRAKHCIELGHAQPGAAGYAEELDALAELGQRSDTRERIRSFLAGAR